MRLATLCKSVVCSRLTPAQKGRLVTEIKKRLRVVVLAIGDGGNDAVMIKQASVGIGLSGEEGTAAVRAADFAISEFRHLHPLLFVHGFWSYRRMSKLVSFIFYKVPVTYCAVVVAFCHSFILLFSSTSVLSLFCQTFLVGLAMFLFGWSSVFSGQQVRT
jgi:P-type E1-E2 ATPase